MAQAANAQASETPTEPFNSAVVLVLQQPETEEQDERMTQDEATEIVLSSHSPVIVITKDSTQSYAGMMKYISQSFPNVPIVFEDNQGICDAPINDIYMATNVMKGDFRHKPAQAHFSAADTIIIFGNNTETIETMVKPSQAILSENTVEKGFNVAHAALSQKGRFQAKSAQWKSWNNRRISPSPF